ncbi:nucleotide-binding protein [Cellulomonas hominis]|uniref:TIR domain-containing protein n=1 Tax=Cellulomonas hominis TaxID=156981 RepID=UPI001C109C25|nr:TIR domain-containing protein [Cellulomonas hominis]MBU5423442.1 nucleotide-binding protein [Cellulomonas hominis]
MSLPIKTTVEDIRTVVAYFRTKPAGATVAEARGVIGATPLDGRKLRAYTTWDLLAADGERYKLTDRGRRFSRSPDDEIAVLREVISGIGAYRSAVEWAHHQRFDRITVDELAANWHDHHHAALGSDNETTIKASVVCFFSLAAGAGLGRYVIGRGGQSTRLEVDRGAIRQLVEAGPSSPPWSDASEQPDTEDGDAAGPDVEPEAAATPVVPEVQTSPVGSQGGAHAEPLRVFISHGKNMEIVDQVKTTLEIAGIQAEVAVEEESTAIPVPDKVFGAMRSCTAGIICVSAEAGVVDATFTLNQNVLIEIGAAFVLYDKRVVLLWDKRVPVPSNLQGLYRCEYEGDELSWSTGMKLMKAIQGFRGATS